MDKTLAEATGVMVGWKSTRLVVATGVMVAGGVDILLHKRLAGWTHLWQKLQELQLVGFWDTPLAEATGVMVGWMDTPMAEATGIMAGWMVTPLAVATGVLICGTHFSSS